MPVVPFLPAIAGVAGAAIGANAQNNAAKNAANASQQATDAAVAEQRRQYDLSRQDMQPWLTTGTSALNQLASLYGLQTAQPSLTSQFDEAAYLAANPDVARSISAGGFNGSALNHYLEYGQKENRPGTPQAAPATSATPSSGMDAFFASPDYQFRLNEQNRALTARNAALGIQDSGAAQKAALQYSGNLASSEFNNYANRLSALAGVGQTAAQNNAATGQNFANSYGNLLSNNAQNLGSSYAQQGAVNANMWGNLAGIGAGLLGQL